MRIGVNCFQLQESMGGLRQYFHRLFRELLANDKKHTYVFFYFEHNVREMEHLGDARWKKNAILLKDQRDVLRHLDKIDLYFCPFGVLWPRPVPVPSVVTLVDIQEKYYPEFFTKKDLWERDSHFKASTKTADQVITISEFSKKSIAHYHQISEEKIHVAYLAADESFYKPAESSNIRDLQLPERFIFYPANRWFHKNHDNLLRALCKLKLDRGIAINCVLTGFDYDGGYPLNRKIIEYGLADQVKVIGYVTVEEIRYIYSKADMLCFPSLFEGFGMPPLEAMAIGCPVICSNGTSLPEVVGDAALLFNPNDPSDIAKKIHALWNDDNLRDRMIALGKKQATKFSVKKMAEVHLAAFDLASLSYRKSRYLFYRFMYEPLNRVRMLYEKPHRIDSLKETDKAIAANKDVSYETSKIEFGTDRGSTYLRSGWSWNEQSAEEKISFNWALGESASIFLALSKNRVYLTANVRSPFQDNEQEVSVIVDGKLVGSWKVAKAWVWEKRNVTIEADQGRPDVSVIEFKFKRHTKSTKADQRQLALLFKSISLGYDKQN
jgi:glycosyltransferase involved in cell wall biosynthesis